MCKMTHEICTYEDDFCVIDYFDDITGEHIQHCFMWSGCCGYGFCDPSQHKSPHENECDCSTIQEVTGIK